MHKIDLATGAVERIDLEVPVFFEGPESGIVVNGKLIAIRDSGDRTSISATDLSDASQIQRRDVAETSFEMHLAGRASVDSVWLATNPEEDQTTETIEVDFAGEVRRRVEIPCPFSVRWAEGDDLILESPDGTWRYDTATGVTVRMPGQVLAFEPGFVLTSSCDESLQCDVLVDKGNGPEVVDWLSASDEFDEPIHLSPDGSGALLHVYGRQGLPFEFTFIDLHTGSRLDLGELGIDPYSAVWVEGSRWIIGPNENVNPNRIVAIDTETGTQVELELGAIGFLTPPLLAVIPPN